MLHLLAVTAALAGQNIDLPRLFADQLPRVRSRSEVPVLLPQTLPDDFPRYIPSGAARRRAWRLSIAAAPGCHGANVCFVAEFRGRRGARPSGERRVALARGRTGWFTPLSCGASCTPPSIEWRERGATFSIQAKVRGRRALVRMADSAIRHGRR